MFVKLFVAKNTTVEDISIHVLYSEGWTLSFLYQTEFVGFNSSLFMHDS